MPPARPARQDDYPKFDPDDTARWEKRIDYVLPSGWKGRTIQTLRQKALRLVGKVTKSARQFTLKVRASIDQIRQLRTVRCLTYQMA